MKKDKIIYILFLAFTLIALGSMTLIPTVLSQETKEEVAVTLEPTMLEVAPSIEVILEPTLSLSEEQEKWVLALEMCESGGNPSAVNPMDADGTPSYGAWQFKPSTLLYFWRKYEVAGYLDEEIVKSAVYDRSIQYAVLKEMVLHRDEINWSQQFPACTRKLGYPPA